MNRLGEKCKRVGLFTLFVLLLLSPEMGERAPRELDVTPEDRRLTRGCRDMGEKVLKAPVSAEYRTIV